MNTIKKRIPLFIDLLLLFLLVGLIFVIYQVVVTINNPSPRSILNEKGSEPVDRAITAPEGCFTYADGLFSLQIPEGWISYPGRWNADRGYGSYMISNRNEDQLKSENAVSPGGTDFTVRVLRLKPGQTFVQWAQEFANSLKVNAEPGRLGSNTIYHFALTSSDNKSMDYALFLSSAQTVILFDVQNSTAANEQQVEAIMETLQEGGSCPAP